MPNPTEQVWRRLDDAARSLVHDLAGKWACEPAAILAIIEVESGGRIFAEVDGREEPLIRFEGHYFHDRLEGGALERAVAEGLADPQPQAVANPSEQAARWAMLARAEAIDRAAARESCSWGLGQVMGAHWRRLGYPSVDALVEEARRGAEGQIALMARFIEDAGLQSALRERDWHRFARVYNGAGYEAHGYHQKLAAAHERALDLDLGGSASRASPYAAPPAHGPRPPFGAAALLTVLVKRSLDLFRRR